MGVFSTEVVYTTWLHTYYLDLILSLSLNFIMLFVHHIYAFVSVV